MSFPKDTVASRDFETFFETSRIWLFGKPFKSLTYERSSMAEEWAPYDVPASTTAADGSPMPPRRIERFLRRQQPGVVTPPNPPLPVPPIFARIYSFSFEGHYYKLPRPLLFLVYGDGAANEKYDPEKDVGGGGAKKVRPFNTKFTGIEAKEWYFADDIRMWGVDRRDVAVCLDVEVGPYQEVLLDSQVAFEEEMASRGSPGSRGSAASRGSASFRGSILGPHQGR